MNTIPRSKLQKWAQQVIEEDIPSFDIGASLLPNIGKRYATLYSKSLEVILAGRPFVEALLEEFQCKIEWLFEEGSKISSCSKGSRIAIAQIFGEGHDLLRVERLLLNVLTRCSSIATQSRRIKELVEQEGYLGEIAATRKTTPLFRLAEKYSVIIGRCSPHRFDVSSMCMLKDNHIDLFQTLISSTNPLQESIGEQKNLDVSESWESSKSNLRQIAIANVVREAKKIGGFSLLIEVECRSLEDALTAAQAGANVVMLDNFSPREVKRCAPIIKLKYSHVIVEVSGGLQEANITSYLCNDVDVYSMGCLIEGVPTVDFSMKLNLSEEILNINSEIYQEL